LDAPFQLKQHSVLILANHISWWDGFWQFHANQKLFGKQFHLMMLEQELAPRPFFRKAGAFSIQPGHRSVLETLAYTCELLAIPENLVVVYPQGKIESQSKMKPAFGSGILKLISRLPNTCQIVFCVCQTDYGNEKKPTVFMHYRLFKGSMQNVEEEYHAFYSDIKSRS
jgi:1-acyl-sn-glycerol-3-phosphate acyltransferase